MVLSLGIGVLITILLNVLLLGCIIKPLIKFGKSSLVLPLLPRDIAGRLFLRVSLALFTCFFCDGLLLAGTDLLRFFLVLVRRKRFLEPAGKNLPFSSRGRVRASFLPRATLFADLRRRRLFLGISKHYLKLMRTTRIQKCFYNAPGDGACSSPPVLGTPL